MNVKRRNPHSYRWPLDSLDVGEYIYAGVWRCHVVRVTPSLLAFLLILLRELLYPFIVASRSNTETNKFLRVAYRQGPQRPEDVAPNSAPRRCQRPRLDNDELNCCGRRDEVGRTCHGRSQSSPIGITPVQHPRKVPMAGYTSARSTGVRGLRTWEGLFKRC